jgi:glucosamine-6-phosphate deaminase
MDMSEIDRRDLYRWCSVPCGKLEGHPDIRVRFRLVKDSVAMGQLMAQELVESIEQANGRGEELRAIVPCGPSSWYTPFTRLVNARMVSLKRFVVYHMDECLDWQGREIPRGHPYSFRGFMERHFYDPVRPELAVPEGNRCWLSPATMERVREQIHALPPHITYGGWGQDGHMAYNQARRHPYSAISLDELAASSVRIQENNWDTVLALAQRTFGTAWQFVPPMSVTLGMRECLSAQKVRLFSDTGAWKQTALRVALFSEPTPEYPMTLLQKHSDALITATVETASHPISLHPEWDLGLEG